MKVNGEDCYDLNCIGHITKYISAHLFVVKRTLQKCKEFLSQIKITCYDQILEVYRKEKHKPVKIPTLSIKGITNIDRSKYNQVAIVHPREGTVIVVNVDTKNLTVVPYDANLRIYNMYGTV